jgi:hypothetical protein
VVSIEQLELLEKTDNNCSLTLSKLAIFSLKKPVAASVAIVKPRL